MNDEKVKKDLIKYASRPAVAQVIGVLAILFVVMLSVALIFIGTYIVPVIAVLVVGFIIAGFLFVLNKAMKRYFFDTLAGIEADPEAMRTLLFDFANAGRAFNGRMVLGDRFIIGRNTGTVVPYSEVTRVYQYIHSTNGIEDSRILKATTFEGRTIDLCSLPGRGKGDDELNQVIDYMISRNGKIRVGYRQ